MIHRHIETGPGSTIEELPLAALHDLLERGDLADWRPLLRYIADHPESKVTDAVARLVDVYPMYGTSPLIRAWIDRARQRRLAEESSRFKKQTLAELRRSLGKTQTEVAGAMGISQSDYSKLERRKDIRVSTLRAAAAALGGTVRFLVEAPDRIVEVVIGD